MVASQWLEDAVIPILMEGRDAGSQDEDTSLLEDSSVSSVGCPESPIPEYTMANETDLADLEMDWNAFVSEHVDEVSELKTCLLWSGFC